MAEIKLGVDLSFAKKRFPEPEVWIDIVKNKIGLTIVEFDSDFLDPFFVSEPGLSEIASETKKLVDDNGLEIHNYFTGTITHCVNLVSHPDERVRKDGIRWCQEAIKLATKLGAKGIGGHFDMISSNDLGNPDRYKMIVDHLISAFQDLSVLAKQEGQEFILWEQMYTPNEIPYTIHQTKELMERVNEKAQVPIQLVIDLGHMCCQAFPHDPQDTDPYEWIRQLGYMCPVMHLQQCGEFSSDHWPFTKQCNERGFIDADKVIEAVHESGAKEILLAFEVFFGLSQSDEQIISDMAVSAEYWKKRLE